MVILAEPSITSLSRLANGGEICIWRLVPPVGHCNTLYVGSVNWCHLCSSQEDPHNTVMQLLPTFFQALKTGYNRGNGSFLTTSKSLTFLGNGSFER